MSLKAIYTILFLSVLTVSSFTGALDIKNQIRFSASDYDIIIPDDFQTIQEGIDNANPWDKIFIRSGIYKETLTIEKEGLLLQGENKYNTVIDGCKGTDDGIVITAENITIKGLTITDFRQETAKFWAQAAIKIYKSNVIIKDNRFEYNRNGVEVYTKAYNITIENNTFINDGIFLGNYIGVENFPDISIKDYIHNIKNNTVNGMSLYYCRNKNDFQVPVDVGQIILINCTNVTIKNLYMSNNDFPVFLGYCNDCIIENLTINNADGEFLLFQSNNNIIQNNSFSNMLKTICIEYKSRDNIVRYNDLSNSYVGLSVFNWANNNSFYKNKVYNCIAWGMEIVSYYDASQKDNVVFNNEFYNNDVGILMRGGSKKNIIQNNLIKDSNIGIFLNKDSNDNKIQNNTFKKDNIPAIFYNCKNNFWYNNYWNRPRFLPKTIIGLNFLFGKIPIPSFDFDKKPAKKPII